jgi:hypothetical protein
MSALALSRQPIGFGFSRSGSSPEAKEVQTLTRQAFVKIKTQSRVSVALNDLDSLQAELFSSNDPLVFKAPFDLARRFLFALPTDLAAPELSLDPDGEIAFDWAAERGRNFSVSLGSTGRLSFAGKLGPEKCIYGMDQFDEVVAREIVDAVKALASDT